MMKNVSRAINDAGCEDCTRKKKNRTKDFNSDLNTTMGACLDLHSRAPMKILLVPCESQPCSSTRYWILDKRRDKIPFLGSSRCTIVQHMGNRVSEPFHGHVFSREGRTIIKGILTDGASEGKYFELVLFASSQELNGKIKTCRNTTELCGFLRRSSDKKLGNYEETHDAFLHTGTETCHDGTANLGSKNY
ncbi:uncharacterized protein [Montipora capricornis]|uniref:uncharacterized protein n=1 Tax=Montipora foliosa TaxID=591990 RepID=UPI0035F132F4